MTAQLFKYKVCRLSRCYNGSMSGVDLHNHRVVYKSRQPVKFTGFSARFRRLLSLLHEPRYVEMFIRAKLY